MITIDDFSKVEIRAGKILSAEEVEGSNKLLKLSVDFGPVSAEATADKEEARDIRQVVSGIKKYFNNPEDALGITCAFITNLEPRSIMGLESQAMIMASSGDSSDDEAGYFSLLRMDAPPGSKVH